MRIAKALALLGIASRRQAEKMVLHGRVVINGDVVLTPVFFVYEDDSIRVDGKDIVKTPTVARIWKFFKPICVITSTVDEQNRQTIFDFLPKSMGRVMTVGRLDYKTEGLLLLTNKGYIARHLELPKHEYERRYLCRFYGKVPRSITSDLDAGICIDGIQYKKIKISIKESKGSNHWAEVVLLEGKNREIRRIFTHYGLQVSRLIRVNYGPYALGDMKSGCLEESEISINQISDEPKNELSKRDVV
jgi:23S rRNA pseudouridine2605 synthase|tara:strand:+ start:251 stop:988 length:738 start_codon:yes stop_codon:yes gene_type:complete